MQAEERRHHAERAPDEDGVPVLLADARDGQRERRNGRDAAPRATTAKRIHPSDGDRLGSDEVSNATGTTAANAARPSTGTLRYATRRVSARREGI